MLIQILAGTFGHQTPAGRVVPIRAGEVVQVDENIGARLVAKGVAVEVEMAGSVPPELQKELGDDAPENDDAPAIPEYNDQMSRAQLEEIGIEMGLEPAELQEAKNKAAVIALLDELKAELEEEAPGFDPAAAIK
jgi:hypothetical protein